MQNVPGGEHGNEADLIRFVPAHHQPTVCYGMPQITAGLCPINWQMRLGVSGQYTRDSWFQVNSWCGGASSVRGFAEREIADDKGYQNTAEIYTPNLCSNMQKVATQCQLLGFYRQRAHFS